MSWPESAAERWTAQAGGSGGSAADMHRSKIDLAHKSEESVHTTMNVRKEGQNDNESGVA